MMLPNYPAISMNCVISNFIYNNQFLANSEMSQSLSFLMNMSYIASTNLLKGITKLGNNWLILIKPRLYLQ